MRFAHDFYLSGLCQWIILLDKPEICNVIPKLDYSRSVRIVHFNKISWIIMRGDEVQTAVMCADVSICL